jgi:large subunit ribosomal protein L22
METVAKKTKRSVLKREKKEAAKLARKQGPATAHLRNVPTSDRKMRLVADLVRGQKVMAALGILKYQAKKGSIKLDKLLKGVIADWQAKNPEVKVEDADLYVKEIFVNGGRQIKRLRTAPQGRGYRMIKRSNHITITVDAMNASAVAPKGVEKAEEKAPKAKAAAAPKAKAEKAEKPAAKKTTKKAE